MKIGKINSSQDGIVHSVDGYSQALSAGHGNVPKILINETNDSTLGTPEENKDNILIIKANTAKGFEELKEGDSVNFSVPNSTTRRGRIGKGVAQTLDTACNQGVIQINTSKESDGQQPYQQNRVYDIEGISPTISVENGSNSGMPNIRTYDTVNRIRRLTEIECERLQGLPDNHTKYGIYDERPKRKDLIFREQNADLWAYHTRQVENITLREISATQRYRLCGNGVSKDIVLALARKLLKNNTQ